MYKFSLQIDDKKHSLTAEDGISIDLLSELLKTLYSAIDDGEKAKCTLYNVRGNCYAIDFSSQSESQKNNFIRIHKDLIDVPYSDLPDNEKKYATTLQLIFKRGYFINAAVEGQKFAHLTEIRKEEYPESYIIQKTVYGIISEQGGPKLNSNQKHIRIDGYDKSIKINNNDDLRLKQYYRTTKLAIKIRVKVSIDTGNEYSAELINFREIAKGNFIDKLNEEEYIPLHIFNEINDMDSLIKKIYGAI